VRCGTPIALGRKLNITPAKLARQESL